MAGSVQNLRRKRQQAEEKMAQLQQQLAALRSEEEQRLGQLAGRAGLLELELGDEELLEAFGEIARRFQGRNDESGSFAQAPASPENSPADGTPGTAPGQPDNASAKTG